MKTLFFSKLVAVSVCMLVIGFFIGYGYSVITTTSEKLPANRSNNSIYFQKPPTNMPSHTENKNTNELSESIDDAETSDNR